MINGAAPGGAKCNSETFSKRERGCFSEAALEGLRCAKGRWIALCLAAVLQVRTTMGDLPLESYGNVAGNPIPQEFTVIEMRCTEQLKDSKTVKS